MKVNNLQGVAQLLHHYTSLSPSKSLRQKTLGPFSYSFGYSHPRHPQIPRVSENTPIPMAPNSDNILSNESYLQPDSSPSSPSGSSEDGKLPSKCPKPVRLPSKYQFPVWIRWAAGSILSLLVSLWLPKWATILKIGGEAQVVMHEVEKVAHVVEKVAIVAEKVSEDVVDGLPADQTVLKRTAMEVEEISKEAVKDAQLAEEIIHKVDGVVHEVEGIDALAEPLIDEIIHTNHQTHDTIN